MKESKHHVYVYIRSRTLMMIRHTHMLYGLKMISWILFLPINSRILAILDWTAFTKVRHATLLGKNITSLATMTLDRPVTTVRALTKLSRY